MPADLHDHPDADWPLRFRRWLLSTIAGGYGWHTECGTCHRSWSGTAATLTDADQTSCGMVPDGTEIDTRTARRGSNGTLKKTNARFAALPPTLSRLVDRDPDLHQRGCEYEVAVDGAHDRATGLAAWAFATGAGWFGSQTVGVDHSPQAVPKIEMAAILETVALFPLDQPLVVWSDNQSVVDWVHEALTGTLRRPAWMPPEFTSTLGGVRRTRLLTVRWAPRRSTPLLASADRLAYRAARPPPP